MDSEAEIASAAFDVLSGFATRNGLAAPDRMMLLHDGGILGNAFGVAVEWTSEDKRTAVTLAANNGEAYQTLKDRVRNWCSDGARA